MNRKHTIRQVKPRSFSDVMRLTGATRSELIYWSDSGWIPDTKRTGRGNHRTYSDRAIAAVAEAVEAVRLYGGGAAKHVFMRKNMELVKL